MKHWIETAVLVLATARAFAQAPDVDNAKADAERLKQAPGRAWFYMGAMVEAEGRGSDAVKYYGRAARDGSCHAALRLGQLHERGWNGIPRDYAESLKWYHFARTLGCEVPVTTSN